MKIMISKIELGNPTITLRRLGYSVLQDRRHGTQSFVRRVRHDLYPRFHLYVEDRGETAQLNLHLDQRATVYTGVTAHAGEYDGELVEAEAERIKTELSTQAEARKSSIQQYG